MAGFLTTLVLVLGAQALHPIVGKIRRPKCHTRTLLLLFARLLLRGPGRLTLRPLSLPDVAHVCLFDTYSGLSLVERRCSSRNAFGRRTRAPSRLGRKHSW